MASDPFQFLLHGVFRKFAKGGIIVGLFLVIFEIVKFIIEELFKPGRAFDNRFRETIGKQIILFLERKEQQELKQGFKQVITTTIGGLRGSALQGQIGGNFFNPERIPLNFVDTRRVSEDNVIAQNPRAREKLGLQAARSRGRKHF